MRKFLMALVWLLPLPTLAGDHFFGDVIILASRPAVVDNYNDSPETVREFYAEEARVREEFAEACGAEFDVFNSSTTIGQSEEPHSQPLRPNYWVMVHDIPYEYGERAEKDAYLRLLKANHPECPQDAYIRDVHIGAPRLLPYCFWAREHDASIFEEFCAETFNQILYGE